MVNVWVTNGSTTLKAIANPINAACEQGFVPDRLHMLENPGVSEQVDQALDIATEIITAYGGDEPEIQLTSIDDELEFTKIQAHAKDAIDEMEDVDGEVAIDITPGRKFMSAIAFAVGMIHDADRVYYFHLKSSDYQGRSYPEIPRTEADLIDFREVY